MLSVNRNRQVQKSFGKGNRGTLLRIEGIPLEDIIIIKCIVVEFRTYNIYRCRKIKIRISFCILRVPPSNSVSTTLRIIIESFNSNNSRSEFCYKVTSIAVIFLIAYFRSQIPAAFSIDITKNFKIKMLTNWLVIS